MIDVHGLRKVYGGEGGKAGRGGRGGKGGKVAVDDLSFAVRPGLVTGFLGPNGSGKSTTMRMVLGLDEPTAGRALVDGVPYAQHRQPLAVLGALIDAKAVHPGRSALRHLQASAATAGIGRTRVHEVLAMVGLQDVARQRVGSYSLGMAQRLGIATALLGDPANVMFDEPVNGLDPDGILWVRTLMRQLAAEGRAVLVSSHLMSEMALTADHLVVIGRGRLIADEPLAALLARAAHGVLVRSPQIEALRDLVAEAGGTVRWSGDGLYEVQGLDAAQIGDAAARRGVALHELTPRSASLEEAFMELTADAVEYRAEEPHPLGTPQPRPAADAHLVRDRVRETTR